MFDNLALNRKKNLYSLIASFLFCFCIVQVHACAQLVPVPCQDLLQKIKIFASLALTTATTTTTKNTFISLCFIYMKITGPRCPCHRNLAQKPYYRLAAKVFCIDYYWQQFSLAEKSVFSLP